MASDQPTATQVRNLGKRLRLGGEPADEDLVMLEAVLTKYDACLVKVESALSSIGFEPTTRLKTTDTLVDKLKRTPGMALPRMQDVAGARITVSGGRREQDQAVSRIVDVFTSDFEGAEVKDRRVTPSSGYRAVHVVVQVDGRPVEIQVRTPLQDLWAQLFEKLGDRWGREIRYGGDPELPEEPAFTVVVGHVDMGVPTRRVVCDLLRDSVSDAIDSLERSREEARQMVDDIEQLQSAGANVQGFAQRLDDVKSGQQNAERFLTDLIQAWRINLEGLS